MQRTKNERWERKKAEKDTFKLQRIYPKNINFTEYSFHKFTILEHAEVQTERNDLQYKDQKDAITNR